MKTNQWPVRIIFFICALQIFFESAYGEVWKSKEFNCEIILPTSSDWVSVSPPAAIFKVATQNKSKGETITVIIVDAPQDGQTLAQFIPGFKKGYYESGGISTDQKEQSLAVDGRAACELTDTVKIQGKEIGRMKLIVIDSGRVYQVGATSLSGNPLNDPDLENSIKSFHFLGQSSTAPASAQVQNPKNLPRLIGRITGYALLLILAVGLIVKFAKR